MSDLSAYLATQTSYSVPIIFALGFVVAGMAFKLGAVPFHMWLPDVYEGAPVAITQFVGTAPKIAAFAMLIRLLSDGLQPLAMEWRQMLIVLSIASIVLGNVVAIAQTNIKRMLAYSTIAHAGFILLGILVGSEAGYMAAMFYTIVYALMALGAFGLLVILSGGGQECEMLSDLKGLNKSHSWLAFLMLIIMFSMAGIPLTVGFYAKLFVLREIINVDLLWLAIFAIVMSIVGAFYYLRVIKFMYFDESEAGTNVERNNLAHAVFSINALAIVILFLLPDPLLKLCAMAFS